MSIEIIKQGRFFSIHYSEEIIKDKGLNYLCAKCNNMLDHSYSYLIRKFWEMKILVENFEPLCCFCFYIKNTYNSHPCLQCGSVLDFRTNIDKIYTFEIFCTKCKYKQNITI